MIKDFNNKRITYIDLFRATGIIAMIMGHINFGWHFDHLIHGFHMPMFFFVSGYFFKRIESSSTLLHKIGVRCKTLLMPYFLFAVLHIVMNSLLNGHFQFDSLRLLFFNTDLDGIPIAGALWFLTSLFLADVIYMILDYILGYGIIMHCIILAVGLAGNVLGLYLPIRLPFGIDVSFVGMVFMHIGRIIHQEYKKIVDLNVLLSLLFFAFGCVLIIINPYVNLRQGQYGNVLVFWISSTLTIIGLWNICRIFDKWINSKNILQYVYILNIGRDSIVYVCLNQLAILVSFNLMSLVELPMWPTKICVLIITMILLEGLRRALTKTKLKCLIGKN